MHSSSWLTILLSAESVYGASIGDVIDEVTRLYDGILVTSH